MVLRAGLQAGLLNQSSAQVIDGSLKFDKASSQHLSKTFSSGNRRTWTWSCWVKNHTDHSGELTPLFVQQSGSSDDNLYGFIFFNTDGTLAYNGWFTVFRRSAAKYRDTGWMHVVVATDSTHATVQSRMRLYVNGEEITDWTTNSTITENFEFPFNHNQEHRIARITTTYAAAQLSQVYWIDGQQLGPEYFGFTDPLTNTWRPKKFSGSFTGPGDNVDDWIGMTTGTQFNDDTSIDEAFDGVSTSFAAATGNSYFTFTPTTPITGITNVRLTVQRDNSTSSTIELNDVDISSSWSAGTTATVTFARTTLSKVKWGTDSSNQWFSLGKIEVEKNGVYYTLIHGNVNGFHLPMDGNSPIGQDKSGRGNDWTPVNFGGSNTLEKATGALPILNTTQGGTQAGVGVRTDAYANNLVLALPLVGNTDDISNQINSGSTTKTTSDTRTHSSYGNFYSGSAIFTNNAKNDKVDYSGDLTLGTNDFTLEFWMYRVGNGSQTSFETIVDTRTSDNATVGFSFGVDSGGSIRTYGIPSGTGAVSHGSGNNTGWNHFALVRGGGEFRIYQNGILVHTSSAGSTNYSQGAFRLGCANASVGSGDWNYNGYLQDLRVYRGIAKYTSNFIPASTSPDILPDTPSGVSGGSKLTKITDGAVHFDGSGDYLRIAATSNFDQSPGTDFTAEAYIYMTAASGPSHIFGFQVDGNNRCSFYFTSGTTTLNWYTNLSGSGSNKISTSSNYVSLNAWHHVAVTRSGSTSYLFVDGILQGTSTTTDYPSGNQLLDIGTYNASGYNPDSFPGFISNVRYIKGTALYTSNFTPPTAPLTNVTNTKLLCCQSPTNVRLSPVGPNVGITTDTRFNSNFESIPTTVNGLTVTNNGSVTTTSAGTNSYGFTNCADLSGSNSLSVDLGTIPALTTIDLVFKVTGTTDNKYVFGIGGNGLVRRSSSSFDWYNGSDTDITTSEIADGNWHHLRVTPTRLWFDNTLIENNTSLQFINNNTTADGDNSGYMALGAFRNGSGTIQYNGAIDFGLVRVMPGVDLGAPSSYPITTNGTLSDTETIPSDGIIVARGNSAATTLSPFTTDINTVRGQETGYATLNPLTSSKFQSKTLKDGNLEFSGTTAESSGYPTAFSNLTMNGVGKWYMEVYPFNTTDTNGLYFGICDYQMVNGGVTVANTYPGGPGGVAYAANGTIADNGSNTFTSQPTYTAGDVISVAYDADNGKVYFAKNGAYINDANPVTGANPHDTGRTGEQFFVVGCYGNRNAKVNFGQKPFKFPPPDGFQPLNAANLRPSTVISRPDQYVGVTTYTGNGGTQSINVGFKPDLAWVKNRDEVVSHFLYDTVRGDNNYLRSDDTFAEDAGSSNQLSFVTKGFTVSGAGGGVNKDTIDFVAWSWKAGGNKNTFNVDDVGYATASAAGLNGGSGITLTGASVGTKQGFSILRYTGGASGSTLSHGLTQAPDFWIIKNLSGSTQGTAGPHWYTKHKSLPGGKTGNDSLFLNLTNAQGSNGPHGICKTSGDNLFEFVDGSSNDVNWHTHDSAATYICYAWHDVPGLQKFGTYEGNNSTNGPFIELGFRPAIIIFKNIDSSSPNWEIYDFTERDKINPYGKVLSPNSNIAENDVSASYPADALSNGIKIRHNGAAVNAANTYIYAAWAEAPSFNLYGGQSNAR